MSFKRIYQESEVNNALWTVRKAALFYAAVSFVFAGFCAAFMALYIVASVNVILCFFMNFLASVAFIWFSVIFFKLKFSVYRENLRFFRMQENALITYSRGVFTGDREEDKGFVFCTFQTLDGVKKFRIKSGAQIPFTKDRQYDLQLTGDLVIGFAEAENV